MARLRERDRLQELVLRREARESDFLIRWGGEEILFVGHTPDLDGAATVVARLHQAIREHAFDLGLPQPVTITCSIGFSLFPFQSDHLEAASWEDQVRVADRCLYAAKRSGRDGWVGVAARSGLRIPGRILAVDQFLQGLHGRAIQSQITIHNRCPIFIRLVFKYRSLCGLGFTRIGTCSTIFRP